MTSTVSEDFDFKPQYMSTTKGRLHYISEGEGDPVIFLHGIPSWSYVWRNVIPYLRSDSCCYAFDFLGFGLSDKPELCYEYQCYVDTLAEFIETLQLEKITLVMHGFGGIVGSIYARNNPHKIKGLAYLESHICGQDNAKLLSLPVQNVLNDLKSEELTKELILNSDYYLDTVMKPGFMGHLSEQVWGNYTKPFQGVNSRQAIWQYLQMLPYGEENTPLMSEIREYSAWLEKVELPKLLMVAMPGFIVSMETVSWAKAHLKNLDVIDVGDGLHYLPEHNPDVIGLAVHKWYEKINN